MTRRIVMVGLAFTLGCALSAVCAFSDDLNLSTGVAGGATYTVVEQNSYNSGATATATVVAPGDADWGNSVGGYPQWLLNSSSSAWIAYDPGNCCDNGLGNYTTTFTLIASDVSTVSLSGAWTVDDGGVLVLNGVIIGALNFDSNTFLTGFSVPAGSPDFVVGTNTLAIDITQADNFLEGVNLQGTLSNYDPVPEPRTFLLMAAGLLGLLGFFRRALFPSLRAR